MVLTTVELEKIEDFEEQGFFSTAYLALDKRLERKIAVKDLNVKAGDSDEIIEELFHEALKLSRAEHPRILPIYYVGFCSTNGNDKIPRIVTKYLENGTLSTVLKSQVATGFTMPLDRIIRYAHDIIQSLIHLHSLDIVHLDLKASNVFIGDDGKLVIGDFGQSRFIEDGIVKDLKNMYPAIAPEEAAKKKKADKTADIYQFGILLFSLCSYDIYRKLIETEYEISTERLKELFGDPSKKDQVALKQFGENLKRYKNDLSEGLYSNVNNYYNYIPHKIIEIIKKCVEQKVENRYNNFYEIQGDLNNCGYPKGVSIYRESLEENVVLFSKDGIECAIHYSYDEATRKYTLNPTKNGGGVPRKKLENVTETTLRKKLLKLAEDL